MDRLTPAKKTETPPLSRGGFFAIDCASWALVSALGRDEAATYLVQAAGTGPDNATTGWSTKAVEEYTSVSRHRAKTAIAKLIEHGLSRRINTSATKPYYKLRSPKTSTDAMWLPKEIVTDLSRGISPIDMLLKTGNINNLKLFIELYGDHHLASEGGVNRRLLHVGYQRQLIRSVGRTNVWGFRQAGAPFVSPFAVFAGPHINPDGDGLTVEKSFLACLSRLENCGLVEFVTHLVEAADDQGEIIHPLPMRNTGTPVEQSLARAAHDATGRLLEDDWSDVPDDCEKIAPVLSLYENVQLVGIARLRYLPKTAPTLEWTKRSEKWKEIAAEFEALSPF